MFRFSIFLLVVLLVGCGVSRKIPEVPVAETQRDAGTVRITPVAVYHWDKIRETLKPNFQLDANTALTKVLPVTAVTDRRVLDALGASLAVKLPSASEVVTSTTTTQPILDDDGKPTDETQTSLTSEEVLTENEQQLPSDPPGRQFEGQSAPVASAARATLSQDPELQYRAAATLMQEVRFLNTYLENVVVPQGFAPYLMRLQIAVTPSRRDQPLDVFTDLYVFNDDREPKNVQLTDFPRVLPILVTDNLESRSDHELERRLRTFLGSISGTIQGIGASAGIDRVIDAIDELTSNDLNSLFTVSQLTGNGIRLRLGARNDSNRYRYELVPRTYTVTMLVMVQDDGHKDAERIKSRELRVVASTRMHRTDTGEQLELGSFEDLPGRLRAVAANAELIPCEEDEASENKCVYNTDVVDGVEGEPNLLQPDDPSLVRKLITRYVASGDRAGFEGKLCAYMLQCEQNVVQETWAELGALLALRPTTFTYITLPRTIAPTREMFLFAGAPATAFAVSSESATTVRVPVNKQFDIKPADLYMTVSQAGTADTLILAPTKVAVSGGFLQATYPSINQVHKGLGQGAAALTPASIVLKNHAASGPSTCALSDAECVGHWQIGLKTLAATKVPPGDMGLKLATTVTALRVNDDGQASLAVQVHGSKASGVTAFGVKIKNGQLRGSVNSNGWQVLSGNATGTHILELSNVATGSNVEVTLAALQTGKADPRFKTEMVVLPTFPHASVRILN